MRNNVPGDLCIPASEPTHRYGRTASNATVNPHRLSPTAKLSQTRQTPVT